MLNAAKRLRTHRLVADGIPGDPDKSSFRGVMGQETVNCRCLLKVPNPVGLDLSAASTQVTTFFFLPVTGEKRNGPVARVA